MQCVPFELTALESYPTKQSWDAVATELVGTMLTRWNLTAVEPFVGGEAGSVVRVVTDEGADGVLKVGFPHFEAEWEAVGLEAWGESLAPRVLRQDPWTWSILLDLVKPGIPLSRAPLPARDALCVGAELYSRLCAVEAPPGLPRLEDVMAAYARQAMARLPQQEAVLESLGVLGLVDTGIQSLTGLAASASDDVLLHGDFNPGNILQSGDSWVAVDPKPMHGDRAFDVWPLVEQLGSPWSQRRPEALLETHLADVAGIVGCDPERAARWCYARSVLNVSWFVADANRAAVDSSVRELRTWARIISP